MAQELLNFRVAMLVAKGFEQSEMTKPRRTLEDAGAHVTLISPEKERVRGWQLNDWGDDFPVDLHLDHAHAEAFHGLLLPGGVMNPDTLRITPGAIEFIQQFVQAKKPIASICHGPWTLINAGGVRGKTVTSWPSLRVDLENAGATWVDETVVVDEQLVTSRNPGDIPNFNKAMIELFKRNHTLQS